MAGEALNSIITFMALFKKKKIVGIIQIVVICDCNSMKDSNLLLYVLLTQTSTTKPQSFTSFTSFKAIDGNSITV